MSLRDSSVLAHVDIHRRPSQESFSCDTTRARLRRALIRRRSSAAPDRSALANDRRTTSGEASEYGEVLQGQPRSRARDDRDAAHSGREDSGAGRVDAAVEDGRPDEDGRGRARGSGPTRGAVDSSAPDRFDGLAQGLAALLAATCRGGRRCASIERSAHGQIREQLARGLARSAASTTRRSRPSCSPQSADSRGRGEGLPRSVPTTLEGPPGLDEGGEAEDSASHRFGPWAAPTRRGRGGQGNSLSASAQARALGGLRAFVAYRSALGRNTATRSVLGWLSRREKRVDTWRPSGAKLAVRRGCKRAGPFDVRREPMRGNSRKVTVLLA